MYQFLNKEDVKNCTRCNLSCNRALAGWGYGNEIMVIGLAPSWHKTGHEFAIKPIDESDTATLLFNCLSDLGYNDNRFYITNLIKCPLEENRKPSEEELNYCYNQWLSKEILSVSPSKIICLGSIVYDFIKEKDILTDIFEIYQVYHHSFIARKRSMYGEWVEQWKQILI